MVCKFCGLEGEGYSGSRLCKPCYKMKRYYDGTLKCSTEMLDRAKRYIEVINPDYIDKAKDFIHMSNEEISEIDTTEKKQIIKAALASKKYAKATIDEFLKRLEEESWC